MEYMKQDWTTIMEMPYNFFSKTLEWKFELEDEKKKIMKEKSTKDKSHNQVKLNRG